MIIWQITNNTPYINPDEKGGNLSEINLDVVVMFFHY